MIGPSGSRRRSVHPVGSMLAPVQAVKDLLRDSVIRERRCSRATADGEEVGMVGVVVVEFLAGGVRPSGGDWQDRRSVYGGS